MNRYGAWLKRFEATLRQAFDLKHAQQSIALGGKAFWRLKSLSRAVLTVFWIALAGAAHADKPVIVVELYTSQGCSSCPAADAFLHKLARRADVVALSLHVDYWDYIGWKDVFADHKYTLRQHGYAKAGHRRMVYTPQMIIHGRDHVVGNHPMDVNDLISRYQKRPQAVTIKASREGGQIVVSANPIADQGQGTGAILVQLVRFEREATVDIRRGENAGRKISYANVVRDWSVIGEWDGKRPLFLSVPVKGDLPVAVILQKKNFGPILAAMQIR
ncbi:DUF1223 domain-containing protein [Rhodobacteraceae bacterium LMO-12]|nr:DUF1223 domain-containing protein [Rhodobacteraceae bacterium LMO-JJ12]